MLGLGKKEEKKKEDKEKEKEEKKKKKEEEKRKKEEVKKKEKEDKKKKKEHKKDKKDKTTTSKDTTNNDQSAVNSSTDTASSRSSSLDSLIFPPVSATPQITVTPVLETPAPSIVLSLPSVPPVGNVTHNYDAATEKKRDEDFSDIISQLTANEEDRELFTTPRTEIEQHLSNVAKSDFTRDRAHLLKGILRMDGIDEIIGFTDSQDPSPTKKSPKNVRFQMETTENEDTLSKEALTREDRRKNEEDFRITLDGFSLPESNVPTNVQSSISQPLNGLQNHVPSKENQSLTLSPTSTTHDTTREQDTQPQDQQQQLTTLVSPINTQQQEPAQLQEHTALSDAQQQPHEESLQISQLQTEEQLQDPQTDQQAHDHPPQSLQQKQPQEVLEEESIRVQQFQTEFQDTQEDQQVQVVPISTETYIQLVSVVVPSNSKWEDTIGNQENNIDEQTKNSLLPNNSNLLKTENLQNNIPFEAFEDLYVDAEQTDNQKEQFLEFSAEPNAHAPSSTDAPELSTQIHDKNLELQDTSKLSDQVEAIYEHKESIAHAQQIELPAIPPELTPVKSKESKEVQADTLNDFTYVRKIPSSTDGTFHSLKGISAVTDIIIVERSQPSTSPFIMPPPKRQGKPILVSHLSSKRPEPLPSPKSATEPSTAVLSPPSVATVTDHTDKDGAKLNDAQLAKLKKNFSSFVARSKINDIFKLIIKDIIMFQPEDVFEFAAQKLREEAVHSVNNR